MRRIVLVAIVVAVLGIAGYMLLRPKAPAKSSRRKATTADSTGTTAKAPAKGKAVAKSSGSKSSGSRGKTTGTLKPQTKEERRAEQKKRRADERRRKKELKRQERERRRALKMASRKRVSRRTRKDQFYVLKAVVSMGTDSYALIDGRRVKVGDVVMSRRVVAIMPDRIEVEAFGRRSTVRVGESLMPSYTGGGTTRRRR